MKNLHKILLFTILIISLVTGAYYDTGFIEWQQPNGVTFVARQWGDEFESWMETDAGYRIVQGSDKYYYYAILDTSEDEI